MQNKQVKSKITRIISESVYNALGKYLASYKGKNDYRFICKATNYDNPLTILMSSSLNEGLIHRKLAQGRCEIFSFA